jgi:hypothetical protein
MYVTSLGHVYIPSQPVFVLNPKCYVLIGEGVTTSFIVFGLVRPGLEPMIYWTLRFVLFHDWSEIPERISTIVWKV